ncbi:MAG: LssY C-terminal domain-containing protein, partial [Deltaproteobacteria bacterium]|nr:LssY C-terminal domain-containing protein [Deltaproteobacteria bacterium]
MTTRQTHVLSCPVLLVYCLLFLTLSGCATYQPVAIDNVPFKQHSQTQVDGNVRVTAAVLTNQEGEQIFGVNLALRWVQAVWIEVENRDNHNYWLISSALDPDYYAPSEIAYNSHHWLSPGANDRMDDRFRQLGFRNPITPDSVVAEFFFVNLDQDDKEVDIDLISRGEVKFFTFFFQIGALRANTMFNAERHHSPQDVVEVDEKGLRQALEDLACCTTSQDGQENGDPLNLVLIGNANELMPAFVRRGWHRAEDTYWSSIWKTVGSFLFGRRYRYSPVSPL